jgi:hypothetical protein
MTGDGIGRPPKFCVFGAAQNFASLMLAMRPERNLNDARNTANRLLDYHFTILSRHVDVGNSIPH